MIALHQVVDALEALPTTAFLVLDQGRTVLDHGTTTTPGFLASARKSVLSVLYGPAVADGTIRLDATLDELGIDDIGGLLPQERRATVRDLLTSSSGVYHPATAAAGPEDDAPARGTQPPGALFLYNNWDFNTLGTIFERCTGRPVFAALAEDLAAPLGFEDFDPARQRLLGRPDVSEHLAHHLFLSARDLGRLGTMLLQNGRWNDRQVVPASWVAESTSVQVDRGPGVQLDYGYLWWLPRILGRGSFLAIGNFGQYLLCVPPGLVIVHQRAVPDDTVLARTQGTPAPNPIDSVSPVQFMKLVRAVQAALRS
ncbi:serine hydrolase [Amycolatopsis sp., V23-08]|uniref:Serine hydrolase n=1 Tax=Amycolatopsis heterodermiae TaxID=3110235 RepID=A0ABU5R9T0_9PSEU|nr:serine hydrolase [Amycolatopsis sp., V23-08]MEA5362395.1 serine hydrolase [Amycolatopsis sp., V23-08]